jgi:hypothetical protein
MFPEDSPSTPADSEIYDALADFTKRLKWLVPDPNTLPHTLEQLQVVKAEWEPLALEGRKLTNPALVQQFHELSHAMDLVRARVEVWFRQDQMGLLFAFLNYRQAEVDLRGARTGAELQRIAEEMELIKARIKAIELSKSAADIPKEPIAELLARKLGPETEANQLLGAALRRAEITEEIYEQSLTRMRTVWAGEWKPAWEEDLQIEPGKVHMEWYARLTKESEEIMLKYPQLWPQGAGQA